MKKNLVNKNFENMVLPVVPFEVTDKLPQHLRVILSTQIRGVFELRSEYRGQRLQQSALDKLLDSWWSNHWTMIKAASRRPEWSWDDLALLHNKEVTMAPQFVKAQRNIRYFLRGCTRTVSRTSRLTDEPSSRYYTAYLHSVPLYNIMEEIYELIAFEGLSESSKKHTAYLTLETVNKCKEFYAEYNPLTDVEVNGRTMNWPKFKVIFQEGIGKLPEVLYNNVNRLCDFESALETHKDLFKAELYKYLGCCQTTTLSGVETGPAKSTIVNKMLQLYFQFILTEIKSCLPSDNFNIIDFEGRTFKEAWEFFKNESSFTWVSNDEFKHRSNNSTGYTTSYLGTFNQMFTRILDEVSGSTSTEHFIVSYHPCDLITCSLGYNWSSCQSFINILTSFPTNYGRAGSGTSNYSGCYHAGNFGFMTGNGYVVYIPYKEEYPLFLTAKLKRMLMWTNNSLTSMRQNYFYPGKPTDSDSISLAASIRAYLQNVYANSNNTKGTADWVAYSSPGRAPFIYGRQDISFFGYDDPIYKISAVKESPRDSLDIIYNGRIPLLNMSFNEENNTYLGNNYYCSPYYGSNILAARNLTSDAVRNIEALDSEGNSITLLEHDTIIINEDLIVSLDWYKKNYQHLTYVDNKLLYKSKKYRDHNGIRYTLELPANVKACKHCGNLYTEDLLVDGYCMSCAVDNAELDIIKVRDSFINREVALSFTSESLETFFNLFPEDTTITWKSGKKLTEFIPTSRDTVLVMEGSFVVLKSTAKNNLPVYNLNNTLKGGE